MCWRGGVQRDYVALFRSQHVPAAPLNLQERVTPTIASIFTAYPRGLERKTGGIHLINAQQHTIHHTRLKIRRFKIREVSLDAGLNTFLFLRVYKLPAVGNIYRQRSPLHDTRVSNTSSFNCFCRSKPRLAVHTRKAPVTRDSTVRVVSERDGTNKRAYSKHLALVSPSSRVGRIDHVIISYY